MSELLTTREAAALLRVSESFLKLDRMKGAEIPFCTIGQRLIRYRRDVLEAYIEARAARSTTGAQHQRSTAASLSGASAQPRHGTAAPLRSTRVARSPRQGLPKKEG